MKEDRRIKKSKNAIKAALSNLMQKKLYSKITITEICELADINRSTFYSNYESIDELLKEIHFEFFNSMLTYTKIDESPVTKLLRKQIIVGMIEYVKVHDSTTKILFTNNENHFLERNMLQFITEKYGISSQNNIKNYALIYHTIAFFTLLNQWVKDNYPCSCEELAQIIIDQSLSFHDSNKK